MASSSLTPGAPETSVAVSMMPEVPIRRSSDRLRNKPKWLEDYEH